MINKTAILFEKVHVQLTSRELLELARLNSSAFTRKRKLGLLNLIGVMLNFNKRTLQIELDDYFEHVLKDDEIMVSKQAFSKARQNLNPEVFRYLSDGLIEAFYSNDEFDRVLNYRLLAVDGTCIELPNFQQLRNIFGDVGDVNGTVRAYASAMFDIENQVIITSEIAGYRVDERTLAKKHLAKLKELGYKNDLLLYDRGYPSRELMAYHFEENLHFIMRCKDNFLDKKRVYEEPRDEIFDFEHDNKIYSVRRVQFMLPSGQLETLVTSLSQEDIETLKHLYSLRWGIETEYYTLKHVLQIENFSGYTPLSIEQDFYATIYLSNLASGFIYDAKHAKAPEGKEPKKYNYKVNRNELYGSLKNKLMQIVMLEDPKERVKLFDKVMLKMKRNMVPIRPERQPDRKNKTPGIKYPINQRKTL
ncbi:Transposase DDE domain-containing protein [Anaerovirgula multivorans]|uniref:Transposase DDE domain-containing protein n=1 Tax=Anaerovirgula multivorans TaxID=312168 RepID=A0A239LPB8_9FIRM|nr:IS4 family transposase [Anaerovirgula multivorans]SNT32120.1 Transposase DDE domain-containing protein [Anaerovirgula multivorans]